MRTAQRVIVLLGLMLQFSSAFGAPARQVEQNFQDAIQPTLVLRSPELSVLHLYTLTTTPNVRDAAPPAQAALAPLVMGLLSRDGALTENRIALDRAFGSKAFHSMNDLERSWRQAREYPMGNEMRLPTAELHALNEKIKGEFAGSDGLGVRELISNLRDAFDGSASESPKPISFPGQSDKIWRSAAFEISDRYMTRPAMMALAYEIASPDAGSAQTILRWHRALDALNAARLGKGRAQDYDQFTNDLDILTSRYHDKSRMLEASGVNKPLRARLSAIDLELRQIWEKIIYRLPRQG